MLLIQSNALLTHDRIWVISLNWKPESSKHIWVCSMDSILVKYDGNVLGKDDLK